MRSKPILEAIERDGDRALIEYTHRFDQVETIERVDFERLHASYRYQELTDALTLAADRIRAFHERQVRPTDEFEDDMFRLGRRYCPLIRSVYMYGRHAVYPSSVLMNVIPAKVAGVSRIVMVTPPKTGRD